MDRRQLLPPILILLFVGIAAYGTVLSKHVHLSPTTFLNVCWTIASLWGAGSCFRCAAKARESNLRYAWNLFGAGCVSWFFGQVLWNYQEIVKGQMQPFAGWQDVGYVGFGPFLLAGFYFFSGSSSTILVAARKLCNLAILCCCITTIVLLLCGKAITASNSGSAFLFAVLGWGVLIPTAFLGGLLCLWLYPPVEHYRSMLLLVGGSGVMAVGAIQYALQCTAKDYQPGILGDYLALIAFGLIAWASWACTDEKTDQQPRRSVHLGFLEPAMPAICMIAVLAIAIWKQNDLESLLPYVLPALGALAISVGVRDAWSAHIEKELFERLRISENTFRQVVDSNMIGIIFTDLSGKISNANDAFLELVGYSREDLQRGLLNWKALTPSEYDSFEQTAIEEVITRGLFAPYEKEYLRKDGTRVPVLIGGALLPEKPHCTVAFVLDLTPRKNAEKALQCTQARLRAALDHLPFSFWSMDATGRYVYQNPISIAMWGDQLGKKLDEVPQPPDLLKDRTESYKRAFAGEIVRAEIMCGESSNFRAYHRIVVPIHEGDEITGISGVNIDCTTEKLAQLRLKESEIRYRTLAEHSAVGIWHFDENGKTAYANRHMLGLLCVDDFRDLDGEPVQSFLTEESQALWMRESEGLFRGTPVTFEVELVRLNREAIPVLVSLVPQLSTNGDLHGAIATFTDLRELKRAQHALVRNERRFRALVENASDGIAAWDAEGTVKFATPSNTRILGFSIDELVGRPVNELFHPDDVSAIDEARLRAIKMRLPAVPLKARVRHKNGTWRQCEGILTNLLDDPAVGALVVNYHDVTERQQSEDALRESEARLQAFMDNSPTVMFIKDRQGRYLHGNRQWFDLFGFTPENAIGRTDWELFSEEQAQTFTTSDQRTFAAGQPLYCEEPIHTLEDRRVSIVHKFPLRDSSGQIKALGGIVTDITERVRAEQALRLSEERYRNLVNGARDAIFTLSPEGVLTSANPGAETITGVPNMDRLVQPFLSFIEKSDVDRALNAFQRVLTGEKVEALELMILGAGDRRVLMEFSATPQYDNGKIVGILGIGRDITERRALEQQLRQSQKMESVGQLAGGVAHDFNNLLTVIQGNASLIEYERDLPPAIINSVNEISTAADRAAALTRQLLAFSRRQIIQPRALDVNEIIGNLAKMLRRLIGEDITLHVESSDLPLIHADAGMIEQILVNLSVNARDAMPQGGRLMISTREAKVSEAEARRNTEAREGSFVCISVSDSGCGIAPEHLAHVFEPFFTTKDVGKGTGLGLATVYGIVKQHHGWLNIQSTVGVGTKFDIFLPAESRTVSATEDNPPKANSMPRGTETILLVEDEASLRSVATVVLSRLGYKVIQASSGVEALKIWPKHRDTIDLVFTDMVMPDGISGQNLVEQLQRDRPDLKILFTSGYSAQMLARNGRLSNEAYCLQKPYLPPALANAIRAALSGKASAMAV